MREKRAGVAVFETVDFTQEQFDRPILWLLAILLSFMPAAMGSWDPWAEAVSLALACGLAVLLGVKLVRRTDVPFVWSSTYLPIALFFLLAAVQLLPLPASLVAAISPRTFTTNHALLDDLPAAAERLRHLRISFYPEGGWHDLRNLLTVTIVFVVVVNVFRRADQMIHLLWIISWIGAAQALLAILQIITDAHGVYWVFKHWGDARPDGGTFPNHNCFAQFINLSIGAMLGLMLLKFDQTFRRHDYTPAEVVEKLGSRDFRWAWVLAGMLALSLASVFLSLSRGGMLSAAIAGVIVGVLLALRGGARGMDVGGWVVGAILLVVFSLIMAGGANLVESRIARIGNPDDRYDRLQLTRDTLRAWRDYPAVGMGLGSYRYAFQAYDRSNVSAVASHAEDDFAELLLENGVVGGAIAASFLVMIFACFLRARARGKPSREKKHEDEHGPLITETVEPGSAQLRRPSSTKGAGGGHRRQGKHAASPASSLAMGLCFGLVAILIQSATDFGQHCVSIACLTAVSCALLVSLARLRRIERGLQPADIAVRGWQLARVGVLALFGVAAALLLWQAIQAQRAASAYAKETQISEILSAADWQGDPGDFIDMNRAADEAARLLPGEMRYRYWRAMNCWYTVSDVRDPVTGDVVLNSEKLNRLRLVADDLQEAKWICPTFGPAYAQLGQWEQNYFGLLDEGARDIRKAFALAPGDPTVCFVLATLELEQGDGAGSVKHFQRAVSLNPGMLNDVIDLDVRYFHRPELALQFADDDVDRLRRVSLKIRALGKDPAGPTTGPATRPDDEEVATAADKRARILIRAAAELPNASAQTLGDMGMLCAKENDSQSAVVYLGRALTFDFGESEWRLQYAKSLARVGRKNDAIHQCEILLLAHPHLPEAEALEQGLSYASTRAVIGY